MFEDMDDIQGLDDFSDEEFEFDVKYFDDTDISEDLNKAIKETSILKEDEDISEENENINNSAFKEGYKKFNEEVKRTDLNTYKGIDCKINLDLL
jgi:hypothetical protein